MNMANLVSLSLYPSKEDHVCTGFGYVGGFLRFWSPASDGVVKDFISMLTD